MKRLNLEAWAEWRKNTEKTIRDLKAVLRTPGHMGTSSEWLTLFDLEDVATRIYMVRAEHRGEGRLHCRERVKYTTRGNGTASNPHVTTRELVPVTREDQRKLIEAYKPDAAAWLWKEVPEKPAVTIPAECPLPAVTAG